MSQKKPRPNEAFMGVSSELGHTAHVDAIHVACYGEGIITYVYSVHSATYAFESTPEELTCVNTEFEIPIDREAHTWKFDADIVEGPGVYVAAVAYGAEI